MKFNLDNFICFRIMRGLKKSYDQFINQVATKSLLNTSVCNHIQSFSLLSFFEMCSFLLYKSLASASLVTQSQLTESSLLCWVSHDRSKQDVRAGSGYVTFLNNTLFEVNTSLILTCQSGTFTTKAHFLARYQSLICINSLSFDWSFDTVLCTC